MPRPGKSPVKQNPNTAVKHLPRHELEALHSAAWSHLCTKAKNETSLEVVDLDERFLQDFAEDFVLDEALTQQYWPRTEHGMWAYKFSHNLAVTYVLEYFLGRQIDTVGNTGQAPAPETPKRTPAKLADFGSQSSHTVFESPPGSVASRPLTSGEVDVNSDSDKLPPGPHVARPYTSRPLRQARLSEIFSPSGPKSVKQPDTPVSIEDSADPDVSVERPMTRKRARETQGETHLPYKQARMPEDQSIDSEFYVFNGTTYRRKQRPIVGRVRSNQVHERDSGLSNYTSESQKVQTMSPGRLGNQPTPFDDQVPEFGSARHGKSDFTQCERHNEPSFNSKGHVQGSVNPFCATFKLNANAYPFRRFQKDVQLRIDAKFDGHDILHLKQVDQKLHLSLLSDELFNAYPQILECSPTASSAHRESMRQTLHKFLLEELEKKKKTLRQSAVEQMVKRSSTDPPPSPQVVQDEVGDCASVQPTTPARQAVQVPVPEIHSAHPLQPEHQAEQPRAPAAAEHSATETQTVLPQASHTEPASAETLLDKVRDVVFQYTQKCYVTHLQHAEDATLETDKTRYRDRAKFSSDMYLDLKSRIDNLCLSDPKDQKPVSEWSLLP
ncbi:uncharacterized protein AB675_1449 [Cyphellophora attinorum]|uniref:Uncharacterized protein n=1 Tax=Cyphellophora attinorum TaxID=1664694 RepID=A0A0N1H0D1_9EURO|nr:uncharacterized protein AB675_1449 [Phialophora attinorum]KPI37277.1 hypothetical protein AB675_1449 [Phialophora attinorum]